MERNQGERQTTTNESLDIMSHSEEYLVDSAPERGQENRLSPSSEPGAKGRRECMKREANESRNINRRREGKRGDKRFCIVYIL